MSRIKMLAILSLVYFFSGRALALEWWQTDPSDIKKDPLDQKQVIYSPDNKSVAQSAARVNWKDSYIETMAAATADKKAAINQAHLISMAIKTARALAYEKLAETIAGIQITSDATYDRELMLDSNLRTSVNALIKGAQVVSEETSTLPDGSVWVEVTLGVHLLGNGGLMAPTTSWALDKGRVKKDSYLPVTSLLKSGEKPSKGEVYTGLIIDAGGLGARPAMVPRLKTTDGNLIYGPGRVSRNYMIKQGIVGYAGSLKDALGQKRVGENPLIIKAVSSAGPNKADFVLSDDDAGRVISADAVSGFLKDCRVVIVIN